MSEEPGEEDSLVVRLTEEAIRNVFDADLKARQFGDLIEYFETGEPVAVGDGVAADELLEGLAAIPGFVDRRDLLSSRLDPDLAPDLDDGSLRDQLRASVAEFVLEALHCHNRLNKSPAAGGARYGG